MKFIEYGQLTFMDYVICSNRCAWVDDGFAFYHKDYDGAPDAYDKRYGTAATLKDCIEAIQEIYLDEVCANCGRINGQHTALDYCLADDDFTKTGTKFIKL